MSCLGKAEIICWMEKNRNMMKHERCLRLFRDSYFLWGGGGVVYLNCVRCRTCLCVYCIPPCKNTHQQKTLQQRPN